VFFPGNIIKHFINEIDLLQAMSSIVPDDFCCGLVINCSTSKIQSYQHEERDREPHNKKKVRPFGSK